MKLHIKEVMHQLAFLEDTMFSPPSRKVVTKGASKKESFTPKESSTGRIHSTWERVDSRFPDSQSSQTNTSLPKRKSERIGNYSRSQASTPTTQPFRDLPYITQIPKIMKSYIKNIVNGKGDCNCGFQVIARNMGMDEENHILVHELKTNKRDYLPIFGSEERFQYIMNDLHPSTNSGGIAYLDK
jgi:hypothetical protein